MKAGSECASTAELAQAARAVNAAFTALSQQDAAKVVETVLRSLREPSEGMLQATDNIALRENFDNPMRAKLFWQSMIDAVLAQSVT